MKKVTTLLTGGVPLAFLVEDYEVNNLREQVRQGTGVFQANDANFNVAHVMAFMVGEPDEEPKPEEDGCNT